MPYIDENTFSFTEMEIFDFVRQYKVEIKQMIDATFNEYEKTQFKEVFPLLAKIAYSYNIKLITVFATADDVMEALE